MGAKTIHQIWLGDHGQPFHKLSGKRWQEVAARSGWGYRMWDEDSLDALPMINSKLFDRALARKAVHWASDVARLEILATYGGLYVDCDFLPLIESIEGKIPVPEMFTGISEHMQQRFPPYGTSAPFHVEASIQMASSFMYAPDGCPVANLLVEGMDEAVFCNHVAGVPLYSHTLMASNWVSTAARQFPVTILPNWYVNLTPESLVAESLAADCDGLRNRVWAVCIHDYDLSRARVLPEYAHAGGATGGPS